MPQSVMERQRKRREKMKSQNFSLVSVWVPKDRLVEIKAIAAQMIEENSNDLEPSPSQLAFAQLLCDKKGLKISQDILSSSKKLSGWLDKNKKVKDRKGL
jgi:hypothetical protein